MITNVSRACTLRGVREHDLNSPTYIVPAPRVFTPQFVGALVAVALVAVALGSRSGPMSVRANSGGGRRCVYDAVNCEKMQRGEEGQDPAVRGESNS